MDERGKSLLVMLAPGLVLDALGALAILNYVLQNDQTSLFLGIGILVLGGAITALRLLAWQRDGAGRK